MPFNYRKATIHQHLYVEPVLSRILHTKTTMNTLARLRCHASSSINAVHFLVVTVKVDQLQPRDATKTIGPCASIVGCNHLVGDVPVDRAEVDLIGLQLEKRDTLIGELVVTGESVLGELIGRDGITKGNLGDRRKHSRGANAITSSVEERGYCANRLWCLGCGCGCACVVLYAATDSDVGKLEAGTDCWKTRCFLKVVS